VLRAIKLGEADKIVTIFTQGHGKIRAVAKGIRKTTSKFGARLEPMSRVALQCYKGRELDIVTQAESLDSNRALREEYALLTRSVPMLEAVDQVAQDREPNPAMYRMLTGALPRSRPRNPLVTPVLLEVALARRVSTRCSTARAAAGRLTRRGGAATASGRARSRRRAAPVCRAVRAAVAGRSPGGLALLRRVLGGGLNGALAETPGPAAHEVEHLGIRALEHHVERRAPVRVLL
jgi:DNA repair protein RecO (recombination protein O)